MKNQLTKLSATVFVVALLGAGTYWYWQYRSAHPETDDAYVQANVIHVAAQVTGPVSKIYVTNHQHVDAGQALFDINAAPFQITVNRAKAELTNTVQQIQGEVEAVKATEALVAERQAQLVDAQKTADRINTLVKKKLEAQQAADDANAKLNVAKSALAAASNQLQEAKAKLGLPGTDNAQIRAAEAELAQAELNLKHTYVTAKSAGYLVNFNLRTGSMITAEQPQFVIIEDNQWWVQANFKETDLALLRPGQPAKIIVDMYPDHTFNGIVKSISTGSGAAFSLLPPEDATGNWVKVTQRFPVRIVITDASEKFPLRMGASSTVVVNTTKSVQ